MCSGWEAATRLGLESTARRFTSTLHQHPVRYVHVLYYIIIFSFTVTLHSLQKTLHLSNLKTKKGHSLFPLHFHVNKWHWWQRKNCWQIQYFNLDIPVLSVFNWLTLIFLFSPSLHFPNSHFIFYFSFCTKPSFFCYAFQFHRSQTLSASVLLGTGLSVFTLKKNIIIVPLCAHCFFCCHSFTLKAFKQTSIIWSVEIICRESECYLCSVSNLSSWINIFSRSASCCIFSSHSSLALCPLCVQTCCNLFVPASGSNPSSLLTPFLPRHLSPSLHLLSLLVCLFPPPHPLSVEFLLGLTLGFACRQAGTG